MSKYSVPEFVKRKWVKNTIQVLVLLIIFISVRAYTQRGLAKDLAPGFSASLLTGTQIDLEQYRGKPVLLHFWASWCSVCALEQDTIQSLSQDYKVLTVAMNSGEAMEVAAYLEEKGLDYPTIADPDGQLARRYGVRGVPSSFFIDSHGYIQFIEVGFTSEWGMRGRLWWLR